MFALETTDPCSDGQYLCQKVLDWTDSTGAAWVVDWLVGKPLKIAAIVLIALVVRFLLHRLVDRVVSKAEVGVLPDRVTRMSFSHGKASHQSTPRDSVTATRRVQRAQTMGSLLKSIVTGIVLAITVTMVLAEVSINVAPIIASAGILGLALGFGAQSLVSDFLSGVFMIFEDQYGVGDVVDLGEASGTVEAVSLRVTRVRDVNGTVWYVRRVLQEVAHDLWVDEDFKGQVIEEPEVWGVQDLAADGVTVRVTLKTAPLEQWAVAREMRERIKARFDHEGIEIPFPQRVVWNRGGPGGTDSLPTDASTDA